MVIHAFVLRWKEDATAEDKQRARSEVLASQGKIPGLLETVAGPNTSPRSQGYAFGAVMNFADQTSLDAYITHPLHLALLQWLVPLVDAIDLDLNA